jgi:hypothetical protein
MQAIDTNSLRHISNEHLALLGLEDVAYVKPVVAEDGTAQYAIYAANGTAIGLAAGRDLAFAAVRQHDLEPVSVH